MPARFEELEVFVVVVIVVELVSSRVQSI